jgi:predicted nucleotide-binding protein (sugar kinase/HSP70/actin superfamily)
LTIGQLIFALNSKKYDLGNTSVIISQTGGGCRATNYIAMIKKALKEAGFGFIPVLSLNFVGMEKHPGFKISLPLLKRSMMGLIYGDLLMRVLYKVRPYEKVAGSANKLYEKWRDICLKSLKDASLSEYKKNITNIVDEFSKLEVTGVKKPMVGVVGEILVKYHPIANNNVVGIIESEGAEAVVPDLLDFFFYVLHHANVKHELLDGSYKRMLIQNIIIDVLEYLRKPMIKALSSTKFGHPISIHKLAKAASEVLSLGNISGEGWFLTAEMLELMHEGVNNIICMQPFACLPNHVTGKGVMKELKRLNPMANIVAIDYDPGASQVNQLNRIRLMMSAAFKNLNEVKENKEILELDAAVN